MPNDDSGPPSARDDAPESDGGFRWPTGEESLREVVRTAARGLLRIALFRYLSLVGLIWLFAGAGVLLGAWTLVQHELDRRAYLATFTGRAPGVVEAPWWQVEFEPEIVGDGTHWPVASQASVCARLRFRPEGGEETTTAYCRRFRRGELGKYAFTWQGALGSVPVRWVDGRGMPRIELRLDPELVRWLEERGPEVDPFYDPVTFRGAQSARRADRLLGTVWRDVDDPFLRLLEEWSKPAPEVTVAYPSGDPARAAPLALLGQTFTVRSGGGPLAGWKVALPLGLLGLALWGVGSYLLTGASRWATAVMVVGGLAVLPWASGYAGKALGYLWSGAEDALDWIQTEWLDLPPELVLAAPDETQDAEVLVWTLESSVYARLLQWIDLRPPAEDLDDDGVLRHMADQVHRQAAALPDEELADLLAWAAAVQEWGRGEELGLLFVDAALELRGDESRSEEVRAHAEWVLRAVAAYEPSDNPYRLAVAERRRILDRVPGLR